MKASVLTEFDNYRKEQKDIHSKIEELRKAKENVRWCLDNSGTVDMHGLSYWAGVVEKLTEEIKESVVKLRKKTK